MEQSVAPTHKGLQGDGADDNRAGRQRGVGDTPRAGVGEKLPRAQTDEPLHAWVFFTDKNIATERAYQAAVAETAADFEPRAIERRRLRRTAPGLFDLRDLPVEPSYVEAVAAEGVQLRVTSRWLNAISVRGRIEQLERMVELPFVRSIEPVRRARRSKGA